MKKNILFFVTLLITSRIIAQDAAIGNWRDHLSYKDAIAVSEGNGKVYCATKGGVFVYNKSDNTTERLSKVNGLSDVEATTLSFNSYSNKLLIAYKNSNIDIIDNNMITNISEIKRKNIIGNKSINNIYFVNQYAYLACGFGIVVVNMGKLEISDTYYIGPNGNAQNVKDITSDANYFYAATDIGIYRASKSSNLANYANWTLMSGLPTGIYNTITSFNGKIYTNVSKTTYHTDTMYVYDNNSWIYYSEPFGYTVKELKNINNKLVKVEDGTIGVYDTSLNQLIFVYSYFGTFLHSNQAVIDNNGVLWVADDVFGLVKCMGSWGPNYSYYPNGPGSSRVSGMSISEGNLWVAPGGVNISYGNLYFRDGLYAYKDGEWTNPKGNYSTVVNLDTIFDFVNVYVDPKNTKRTYAAAWGLGVVEFYNGIPIKHYDNTNSSLQEFTQLSSNNCFTWGLTTDADDNLWVSNTAVEKSLSRKTPNGTWQNLDFKPVIGGSPSLGQILVDKQDQKWVVMNRGGGLLVYKGHTMDPPSLTNAKKLSTAIGNGALPSIGVFCLAEDKDGEIWVGTDKGITVFYSPENVFSGQNFDSQQILLEQDGHVQILLETETVQAIAVDDANRKWIATSNSGVFLMSADGTKQIYHFDEDNSPLFSNDVGSISINHETGEVYFGTSKGIISYRGNAIAGLDKFTDVYSFPNPVQPGYEGPIAIKGLMDNSTIKITDISGSLVFETKSEGGQAIWNGKNFKGEKVSTGVYMVFCTSEDGAEKAATKILFIN